MWYVNNSKYCSYLCKAMRFILTMWYVNHYDYEVKVEFQVVLY